MDHFEKKRESIKVLMNMLKKSASDEVEGHLSPKPVEPVVKEEKKEDVKTDPPAKEPVKAPIAVKKEKPREDEESEDDSSFMGLMSK